MTSSIQDIGSTTAFNKAPLAAPGVTAQSTPTTASLATPPTHNPRIIQNPTVGFITQYLSNDGSEVIVQTPTAATVAYLEQGLTAQGLPKQNPTQDQVSTSA